MQIIIYNTIMPEKLKEYIINRGLTYNQISVILGYDKATICSWCTGKRKMGKKAQELVRLKLNL